MSAAGSRFVLVGLSHRTAPVEIRERVSVPAEEMGTALARLRAVPSVVGAALVSTCNRTEAICEITDEAAARGIVEALSELRGIDPQFLEKYLYVLHGDAAVRHVFRVTASLDSLIIGESQIVGQVRAGYSAAQEHASISPGLHQLFQFALNSSRKVRTASGIAESAVSVPYAAVELAKKIFEDFSKTTILVIGSGKMGEIAAKNLAALGVARVICANRTFDRAAGLAAKFGGAAIRLEDVPKHLADADVVVSSTGSQDLVLRAETVAEAMRGRRARPMFLVDIAIPRDIDPAAADLPGVYLYNIDDLRDVVDSNKRAREQRLEKADALATKEIDVFLERMRTQEVVPTIQQLRSTMDDMRKAELERTRKRLGGFTPEQEAALDDLTASIVNRILHYPIAHLKNAEPGETRDTIRRIFGLPQ
jgi:glutamyl-tRNA reductase